MKNPPCDRLSIATLGCRFYLYELSKRIFLLMYIWAWMSEKRHFFIKNQPCDNYYQSQLRSPDFSFLSSNFLNESPFFMKKQPCDTIINPKFEVQFSAFWPFKSNIFTIYVSSNCRKTQFFWLKISPVILLSIPNFGSNF